jgi:hypothetical protein
MRTSEKQKDIITNHRDPRAGAIENQETHRDQKRPKSRSHRDPKRPKSIEIQRDPRAGAIETQENHRDQKRPKSIGLHWPRAINSWFYLGFFIYARDVFMGVYGFIDR